MIIQLFKITEEMLHKLLKSSDNKCFLSILAVFSLNFSQLFYHYQKYPNVCNAYVYKWMIGDVYIICPGVSAATYCTEFQSWPCARVCGLWCTFQRYPKMSIDLSVSCPWASFRQNHLMPGILGITPSALLKLKCYTRYSLIHHRPAPTDHGSYLMHCLFVAGLLSGYILGAKTDIRYIVTEVKTVRKSTSRSYKSSQ